MIRWTHHCGSLAQNAGDCMKDLHYRLKAVDQFTISIPIGLKLLCFVAKDIKNCVGGAAILESLGGGMGGEVYSCLFGIFGQGGIEN